MTYYLVLYIGGVVTEKSGAIESETPPEVVEPYNEVWTEAEWQDYLNSLQPPPPPTIDELMTVGTISDYGDFRDSLKNAMDAAGGFDACTPEQQEFLALNLLGTMQQRATVLTDENAQVLQWQIDKGIM